MVAILCRGDELTWTKLGTHRSLRKWLWYMNFQWVVSWDTVILNTAIDVDDIHGCQIFKSVTITTLKVWQQDSNPSNVHQGWHTLFDILQLLSMLQWTAVAVEQGDHAFALTSHNAQQLGTSHRLQALHLEFNRDIGTGIFVIIASTHPASSSIQYCVFYAIVCSEFKFTLQCLGVHISSFQTRVILGRV